MKRIIPFIALLLLFAGAATAQDRTITGTITGADDGQTLPGVTVLVKGTRTGTASDASGKYKLTVPGKTAVLVFSFVGYSKLEIPVGDKLVVDAVLTPEAKRLDEFVVTALGVKREKREIGYSSEKINTDELTRANSGNVLGALWASAGVQISQGDGVEGGSTRIMIRGNNNLSRNNQPLIVVDNVPMDNTAGLESVGRGVDWGNGIADINPYDIEDYSVLKGGAASALYGERGANGVILITTKRGKKQSGLGVTYNYNVKISHPYRYREVQNKYGHGGPISFSETTLHADTNGIFNIRVFTATTI